MKNILFTLLLLLSFGISWSQKGFDPGYKLLHSDSYVQDKNFYLFTLIEKLPEVKTVFEQDETLRAIFKDQKMRIQQALTDCVAAETTCWVEAFAINAEAQQKIGARFAELCQTTPAIQMLVQQHMRPSGMFIKYAAQSDADLLQSAWREACGGLAYINDSYALGKPGRYPNIDSVSYDVTNIRFKRYIMVAAYFIAEEEMPAMTMPYQPALHFSLTMLDMNNRDEAGRHEPMEYLENRKAYEYIPHINWDDYKYALIMQPGHGPDIEDIPLSPMGKFRVKLVAERYHKGWAPLIVLSGGYVHPFQTPFAEAIEMKKVLMEDYGVPERAIIIEPHARHTTTNFRNTARLMYRYGIPTDKMSLCTTTMDQIRYITDPVWRFDGRNQKELGYLPYVLFEKISNHDVEFKPVITSLHADPLDPLDP